ncbi:hypothetical protein J2851_004036 [Azospirillum rugosum]|uniref:Uncharacterized protein n=1 Tax=Azospirillum rugosum TaxID=416170 RepID=A0ABS4SQK9_9PROT|nr:hypothetical protein [Azospirillum rugosum]MDQ0527582.1 hypothetical protein [Azospirillum rugosum]
MLIRTGLLLSAARRLATLLTTRFASPLVTRSGLRLIRR